MKYEDITLNDIDKTSKWFEFECNAGNETIIMTPNKCFEQFIQNIKDLLKFIVDVISKIAIEIIKNFSNILPMKVPINENIYYGKVYLKKDVLKILSKSNRIKIKHIKRLE